MNQYGFLLPPMTMSHSNSNSNDNNDAPVEFADKCILVNGPVIIGAGPSGLAVGAGLKQQGVPFIILDKANCIASLWQNRTYDRLKLHLPRQFCQLPYLPFPKSFPEYPTKYQFIQYLESYARKFDIRPRFNESVYTAKYDESCGLWRIRTSTGNDNGGRIVIEYICRWIVVATGENAEKIVPEFEGLQDFSGDVIHASEYKSGSVFEGKKVLVVGCGNSGMEVSLDLCHHGAFPSMVVRDSVHILPREILGISTYELARKMLKWLSIKQVDKIMVVAARLLLGNLEKYSIKRPLMGPMELKDVEGKTPVLDNGTLKKIKTGEIKIVPAGIKRFFRSGVELVNGEFLQVDSVVLATGYCSNVPSWLKEKNELFSKEGPFPKGWKGKGGLYAVGFTRKGLSGASFDAIRVAQDIAKIWKQELNQKNQPTVSVSCHKK